jgi:hypothetical protein
MGGKALPPKTANIQREETTMRYRPVATLVSLALSMFFALGPADAQQPAKVPRLGFLGMDSSMQAQRHVLEVREPHDLANALAAAKTGGAQAVLQLASPFFTKHRKTLLDLLSTHHLPASCEMRMYVVEGVSHDL